MGVIVILLVITVVVIAIVKVFDATNNDEPTGDESCKSEECYEMITESEKEQLLFVGGEPLLTFTLDKYQQAITGDPRAMTALGAVYWSKLDIAYKAAYWFKKADRSGDWEGTYWYGECCIRGYGVEKNRIFGFGLLHLAAQHGNETAIDAFRQRGMSLEEMRSHGFPV